MMGKEDLGLSLSLGFAQNHPLQLNLKPTSSPMSNLQMFPWNQTLVSSSGKLLLQQSLDNLFPQGNNTDPEITLFHFSDQQKQQFLRKIDVNSLPTTVDLEEETGVSSPNSTISSTVSGKRRSTEREGTSGGGCGDDLDITLDRSSSRGTSDEEEDYGGETCRKKLRLSKDQSAVLEDTFKEHNTLNPVSHSSISRSVKVLL